MTTVSQAQPRRSAMSPWLLIVVGQIALTVGFFGLWEIAIRAGWLPVYLYGQPSGIASKLSPCSPTARWSNPRSSPASNL